VPLYWFCTRRACLVPCTNLGLSLSLYSYVAICGGVAIYIYAETRLIADRLHASVIEILRIRSVTSRLATRRKTRELRHRRRLRHIDENMLKNAPFHGTGTTNSQWLQWDSLTHAFGLRRDMAACSTDKEMVFALVICGNCRLLRTSPHEGLLPIRGSKCGALRGPHRRQ
jgi:hypothetical protein